MWGRVVENHVSNGVVRAKFRHNLPNLIIIIWYWTLLIFSILYLIKAK